MRTTRPILVVTAVMLVAFAAAAYVPAQAQDLQSLAGKWRGFASPTRGSNVPLEVDLQPDGTYTSMWGSAIGKGVVKNENGKLVAEGQIVNGATAVVAGTGRSELTLTTKDGKQMITGAGRDNDGPYNFQLTKQ
jgi:hypothetical protein